MSEPLSLTMVGLIALCVMLEALYQLCFKQAAHASTLLETLVKPVVWLGIVIWAAEIMLWMLVLEHLPLSVAFPLMSLSYIATLMAGKHIFHERVTKRHAMGALLITAGVACVGATGL